MKVRKLDSAGDYSLGHGNLDFFQDSPNGVAQNVKTRLMLWRGQWFLDIEEGTPWLQQILGKRMAVESVLRSRILSTPGVLNITDFQLQMNPDTRTVIVSCEIETIYGVTSISETIQ